MTLTAGTAAAFDADAVRFFHDGTPCGVHLKLNGPAGEALVDLNALTPWQRSGGSRWYNWAVVGGDHPVSENDMVSCFEDYTPNTLVQKGADAPTFEAQTIMGFGYRSNVSSEWVDIIIGTGTLEPSTSAPATGLDAGLVGDGIVWVAFQAPTDTGGVAITDYEYELDDNGTWTSASTASSPVMITGLTNGTSYSIKLRAVTSVGEGAESAAVTSTPAATSDAPTAMVATPGDGQVSVAFQAPTDTGGAAINDYEYELDDNGTWTSAGTAASPVTITGLTNGTSYSIKLRAVNSAGVGAESAAVSVLLGSAASEFAAKEDATRSVITNDATRSLTSTLNANEHMVREARERLIASQQEGADLATRDNVPFDVDGTFDLDGSRLSTKGTFFEQRGTADGAGQRLFFGDFDVQHDGDTNSTTATITARMAWEQMYTDSTMLGYFVGGELAHSNIKGSFEGEQDRLGVSFGGYAVHQLDEQVFVDGFITV
ncbi:fibronectin type III domain-containing protein, partial [Octadecabacter sp.]|nr:fibronectin type III domain-containing protein [Octadecabacter sp.]